jgi:serine/threonine protein kinase
MASPPLETLGRYRLVRILGRGAMGVVYEARDERLGRTVAIKTVLRSHLDNESTAQDYAARFVREAQAAARLSHPNIVTVYDFGEHDDLSYIVMEFVSGRELAELFRSGHRFTLPQALQIMAELLDALAYAHAQGVVHRDVKPANVLVDQAGHVKLADFGVARISSGGQDRTMPGTMVGTPNYMSPEQILGQPVGSRTDIFAAGVVLYQFLTGRQPFEGAGMFVVQRRILQEEPTPPSRSLRGCRRRWTASSRGPWPNSPRTATKRRPPSPRTCAGWPPTTCRHRHCRPPQAPPARPATPRSICSWTCLLLWQLPRRPRSPGSPRRPPPSRRQRPPLLAGPSGPLAWAWAWSSRQRGHGGCCNPRRQRPLHRWRHPPPRTSPPARRRCLQERRPRRRLHRCRPPAPATSAPPAAASATALPTRPPAPATAKPAPAPTVERPAPKDAGRPAPNPPAGSMRCADILERMQLGEPLSAEQSSFFQSRCAR